MIVESCNGLSLSGVESQSYWKCIQPIVKYGYSISATAEPGMYKKLSTSVVEDWEPQLSMEQQEVFRPWSSIHTFVYYADSIWMMSQNEIVRYQPDNRKLTLYTVKVDETSEFIPSDLFVSAKWGLWGLGNFSIGRMDDDPEYTGKFVGFLSRYDPKEDRFLPVIDMDGILVNSVGNIRINEDSRGYFWIARNKEIVFRLNPELQRTEIVLDRTDGYEFDHLAIDKEDKIWLSAIPIGDEQQRIAELVRYDPELDELTSFGIPPGREVQNLTFPVYIDRQDRIWTGYGLWLEKMKNGNYEWHTLIPQPEFLTFSPGYLSEIRESKYVLYEPQLVFEASDRSMWFQASGLLRLEPDSGEWCRISEEGGGNPIIEDEHGNLWITLGTQLYMKPLKP